MTHKKQELDKMELTKKKNVWNAFLFRFLLRGVVLTVLAKCC